MKTVLMVAFHFPPLIGSSGLHRTVKFAHYLREDGWRPLVLTVNPKVYPQVASNPPPDDVDVVRVFALDSARHLAIKGRYPTWLSVPDRWISWWPAAVVRGLLLAKKYKPDMIWSTFPIATAHLIGLALHRATGIPWIADFRDPMVEIDPSTGIEYPLDRRTREANARIERRVVAKCSKAVFTTPGTAAMYRERYPQVPESRWAVIPNGYDEEDFSAAEAANDGAPGDKERLVLVHSGILYRDVRDPRPFFEAVARLREHQLISARSLKIVLRASGSEDYYRECIEKLGIGDIVFLEPPVSYREALIEMLNADGLLIFQAASCNWQIPAKLYECLRARRPIFALTDVGGDTAHVMLAEGVDTIVAIDERDRIEAGLAMFLEQVRSGSAPIASAAGVERLSRRRRTRELAKLLDVVVNDL